MQSHHTRTLWRYASKNCGEIGDGRNSSSNKYGYGCESYPGDAFVEEECLQSKNSPLNGALPTTSVIATLVTNATKLLRSCCGDVKICCCNSHPTQCQTQKPTRQQFDALMKILKPPQIHKLYLAVKSRTESTSMKLSEWKNANQCILITKTHTLQEEPHVMASRLFFWKDLKNSSQLKRLPSCPNVRDSAYSCCNPLHWGCILDTGSPPPPYRRIETRSEDSCSRENFPEGENSNTENSRDSTLSTKEMVPNFNVSITESLTTDGEGRDSNTSTWCVIAYWELGQRVGNLHQAKKSSVNVYHLPLPPDAVSEEICEEVRINDLVTTRKTTSSKAVIETREKIGLGISLSNQSDGVWIYNRSTKPIFVHSPTLCDSWDEICRVLPGYCVMAFDYQRAQDLKDLSKLPGARTGQYSMRISFVKGYGKHFKRQEITLCPCWLEVLITPR